MDGGCTAQHSRPCHPQISAPGGDSRRPIVPGEKVLSAQLGVGDRPSPVAPSKGPALHDPTTTTHLGRPFLTPTARPRVNRTGIVQLRHVQCLDRNLRTCEPRQF